MRPVDPVVVLDERQERLLPSRGGFDPRPEHSRVEERHDENPDSDDGTRPQERERRGESDRDRECDQRCVVDRLQRALPGHELEAERVGDYRAVDHRLVRHRQRGECRDDDGERRAHACAPNTVVSQRAHEHREEEETRGDVALVDARRVALPLEGVGGDGRLYEQPKGESDRGGAENIPFPRLTPRATRIQAAATVAANGRPPAAKNSSAA